MGANLCDKRKICLRLCTHERETEEVKRNRCLELRTQIPYDRRPIRESDLERGGAENGDGREKWSPDVGKRVGSEVEGTPCHVGSAKS